jgi:hypothetical protein
MNDGTGLALSDVLLPTIDPMVPVTTLGANGGDLAGKAKAAGPGSGPVLDWPPPAIRHHFPLFTPGAADLWELDFFPSPNYKFQ